MKQSMKEDAGLWIDHGKAVILTVTDGVEKRKQILSDIEKQVRFFGGSHSKAPDGQQGDSAEDTQDRRFANHLSVETTDKMTDRQIAAKIRKHILESSLPGPGHEKFDSARGKRLPRTHQH